MKVKNWVILTASTGLVVLSLARVLDAKQLATLATLGVQPNPGLKASKGVVNAKLVTANTRLSFKLFSTIIKQEYNNNVFISPTSVAIALAVTYNGASGKTQQSMAQALELQGMSLPDINQANAALKAVLENLDPKVQLSVANSLWTAQSKPLNPQFIQKIQGFYKAEVKNLNFSDPAALSTINAWVKQSTNSKIEEIVDRQEIRPDTVFVLLNAIYFKGNWTDPFPKQATKERLFTLLNGTQKQHPMMFQELYGVGYYETEMFQAVELPYGERRLSMYIFLPNKETSLKTFYENLNAENWDKWMNQFDTYNKGDLSDGTLVGLPRFKLEYSIDLKDALKVLGMEIAFTGGADFSAMSSSSLRIDKVKHKTFVEVNEEGTEASAVTGVGSTRGGHQVIVDRPFFFAIRDNQTGAILFMGSIVEPM